MDFWKLLPNEVVKTIGYLSYYDIEQRYCTLNETNRCFLSMDPVDDILCDLIIATKMYKQGRLSLCQDIMDIEESKFSSIAEYFSVPKKYTKENLERATRINRILHDYKTTVCIIPKFSGELKNMIVTGNYTESLFIINDTQENFIIYRNYLLQGQYRLLSYTKAFVHSKPQIFARMPVSSNGQKYTNLDDSKIYIDLAINQIKYILLQGNYERILYEIDSQLSAPVVSYIFSAIWSLQ